MIFLALDVGERRIGVAVSDPGGLLATPVSAIERSGEVVDVDEVLRLVDTHGAGKVVVGIPLELSGRRGRQAARVSDFVRALESRSGVPVETMDERYSTVEASRHLRETGAKPSRERGRVDAAAAAVILQSYLDSRRGSPAN